MESDSWPRRRLRLYLFLSGLQKRLTLGTRIALIDGDKVYLIRHTYMPGWHFPGGGVEPGESAEQGARRELGEESGYRLTGRPVLFGLYHNAHTTNRDHVAFYLGREFEAARTFTGDLEIAEVGWFNRQALPADVTEATRRRFAEIFEGAPQSDKW
jgi:ADP-ribose pyrophosphatase YjhB (NUDIX family)